MADQRKRLDDELGFFPLQPAPPGRSLEARHPELAAELHPVLNDDLTAATLWAGTGLKVWWKCEHGHEWQARVSSRVRGSGCPVCSESQRSPRRSLAEMYPDLVAELDPERNGTVDATRLAVRSNRILWWRCPRGHEWQARVFARTGGTGCPVCARTRVPTTRSLAARFPALAEELHPDRNGGIEPSELAGRSNRLVWWRCSRGHEWEARVSDRAAGNGCPHCYRERRSAGSRR